MDILSGVILGVVQGLTEFLPVSSTGHLIIARDLLGLQVEYGLSVDAVLHFATAFAVLIYFRKDFTRLIKSTVLWIMQKPVEGSDKKLILALSIGTVPAVILGLLLQDYLSTVFRSSTIVAWALLAGSLVFILAEYVSKKVGERQELKTNVSIKSGLIIGLFQSIALIPGMSRSGMTISGGLLLGFTREQSARFAFLLSFPIILGAGAKSALDLGASGLLSDIGLSLFVSAIVAFLSGLLAIHYLLKFLRNHSLIIFVFYRVLLAVGILVFL